MLKRYSRQVLTAGKADEAVADSGGPRPNHSIFTGHLLDALEGKAADSNGIISANAVMAYVYDHVAKDPHSRQTPHFGFLDGEGDFIFSAPKLADLSQNEKEDSDILVQVPASATLSGELSDRQALVNRVEDYISEPVTAFVWMTLCPRRFVPLPMKFERTNSHSKLPTSLLATSRIALGNTRELFLG